MDLREVGWGHGLAQSGLGWGLETGSCECGNEPSGSLQFEEVLD
jgi:hypothetical protein